MSNICREHGVRMSGSPIDPATLGSAEKDVWTAQLRVNEAAAEVTPTRAGFLRCSAARWGGARILGADMDVTAFVAKWRASQLKESAGYVSHFEDLCRLVGHETPPEADPTGDFFCYQKGVAKESGRQGFADVWYRNRFGIEYKGKGGDLDAAYSQLLLYRDNLENPPLLITCDFERIEIRTNFTGYVSRKYVITLKDFASGKAIDGSAPIPRLLVDYLLNRIRIFGDCYVGH